MNNLTLKIRVLIVIAGFPTPFGKENLFKALYVIGLRVGYLAYFSVILSYIKHKCQRKRAWCTTTFFKCYDLIVVHVAAIPAYITYFFLMFFFSNCFIS